MIQLELGPLDLALASGPDSHDATGRRLLSHQQRTRSLLRDHDLVVNSFPTGAGKTRAALLHLLDAPTANVLVIAPTRELVHQHVRDIRRFCAEHDLPHQVLTLSAEALAAERLPKTFRRRGDRLARLLADPGIVRGGSRVPYVAVSVPDLFHLALFFRYGRLDRGKLFQAFVELFGYVVVDELHYYDGKQLATFLFFVILSEQLGYFREGRRLALLSATPEAGVRAILDRLGASVAYVEPCDEPPDAERTRILAPVHMRAMPAGRDDGLQTLIPRELPQISRRLAGGEQGAALSSALWRINLTWAALRGKLGNRLGRITGPETAAARAVALKADLILASPTVDIGYDFTRPDKPRQSLDFLYFDAGFADELMQRLGRAGRVLGKPETDHPSDVTAAIDERLYQVLKELEGRQITRGELAARLAEEPSAARNRLLSYLESGSLGEVVLPLYRLGRMLPKEDETLAEELYETVRRAFAPDSRQTFWALVRKIKQFCQLEDDLREHGGKADRLVDRWLNAFIEDSGCGHYDPAQRAQVREAVRSGSLRGRFLDVLRARHAVMAARFAFRDSFQAPLALAWDPHRYLSSDETVQYDLFHLLENYRCEVQPDGAAWRRRSGQALEKADAYVTVTAIREAGERRRLEFRLEALEERREQWLADRTAEVRGFKGLRMAFDQGPLEGPAAAALADRWLVGLAVGVDRPSGSRLWQVCRRAGFFPRRLLVDCAEGRTAECWLLLGTPASLAAADPGLSGALQAERRRLAQSAAAWIV